MEKYEGKTDRTSLCQRQTNSHEFYQNQLHLYMNFQHIYQVLSNSVQEIWCSKKHSDTFTSSYKIYIMLIFTPPRNRGGVIFSLQFVCVWVCVSVCVSNFSCEQNSSRTDAPIWTRFSLNGCLPHWLGPYWIWWPWVKGQGHSDVISIFSS